MLAGSASSESLPPPPPPPSSSAQSAITLAVRVRPCLASPAEQSRKHSSKSQR
ncbi:hypothetical protein HDU87_008732 [Geranomyces variabilis]|uniref:Uncharacterized protein n=1 Tax=Geranomyces variabilis TaxID=109894 RepID=A0AAD5XJM5_9FUNG|nr:hypothetical protein HDU87_008732 [Geranomyces variabilis]